MGLRDLKATGEISPIPADDKLERRIKLKSKPFQFGLRSLFALTTAAAFLLGIAKIGNWQGIPLVMAIAVIVPLLAYTRWFLRDAERINRLGCALTALAFLFGATLIYAGMFCVLLIVELARRW
jgi:hypothetical protein